MAENDNQDSAKQFRELREQNHERAKEIAVLRADMKTLQSDLQGTLERFRADMAVWKADMADWKTDMAKRDKSNMQWIVGFVLGSAVLVITVLGYILTSTPTP